MATPTDVPATSMTRGASFLPGRLQPTRENPMPEQKARRRKPKANRRGQILDQIERSYAELAREREQERRNANPR